MVIHIDRVSRNKSGYYSPSLPNICQLLLAFIHWQGHKRMNKRPMVQSCVDSEPVDHQPKNGSLAGTKSSSGFDEVFVESDRG